jgi:hypothetical protein
VRKQTLQVSNKTRLTLFSLLPAIALCAVQTAAVAASEPGPSVNPAMTTGTTGTGTTGAATTAETTTAEGTAAAAGATAGATAGAAPTQKAPLVGGVKHSESLPALADDLRPGKAYRDDLLISPGARLQGQWLYVPSWYAGTRHCEEAIILYRQNFVTGETSSPMTRQVNRQDDTVGCQKDRNGGIWDFKEIPLIQHVESDRVNAVLYVKKVTPLFGAEDKIVIRYDEISIELSKRTNKIVSIVQQEQINTITSPSPGVLRADISVKAFDETGTPQRLEQSVIIEKTTRPYERKDSYHGQDIRPSFKDYLISHGLENLVPLDLK